MALWTFILGLLILQVALAQDFCPQDSLSYPEEEAPSLPFYPPPPPGGLPYQPPCLSSPSEELSDFPSSVGGDYAYSPPITPGYLSSPVPAAPEYLPPPPPPCQSDFSEPLASSANFLPVLPPLPDISLGLSASECGESYEPPSLISRSEPYPYAGKYANPNYGYCEPTLPYETKKCGCLLEKCKQKILQKKLKLLNKIIGKLYKKQSPNKCSPCKKNDYPEYYDGYYPPPYSTPFY